MTRHSFKILFVYLSAVLFAQNAGWILVDEDEGIEIYTRESGQSELDEFKGVYSDSVRIEVVGVVLLDIAGYVNWLDYLNESEVVKKISDDHFFVYQHYQILWPYHNRDCLIEVKIDRDYRQGIFHVTMEAAEDTLIPEREGIHRITDMKSEIYLQYISREITRGSYSASINFGGNMPDWLINMINKRVPYEVLINLRKECLKEENIEKSKNSPIRTHIENAIKDHTLN